MSCRWSVFAVLALALLTGGCADSPSKDPPYTFTPTPLRQLGERPLFGTMPLANGFFDPEFAAIDGVGWLAYGQTAYAQLHRLFLPDSPTGQAVLRMTKEGNPRHFVLLGAIKSDRGAAEISVWLGRKVDAADVELADAYPSLLGFFADGGEAAVDLVADDTEPVRELGELSWRRFVAALPDAPIGWSYLYLEDDATSDLYLAAPRMVTPSAVPFATRRPTTAAVRRGLVEAERHAWAVAREQILTRLGPPSRRPPRSR